ncbi:uncharacterized protein LOC117643005 [Thrips palmi]|uniref:Uncharacterized protein LOC117643005 n=1 Tax=Thrips palmi TaxID=161013 RepID=A0A6P8YCY5_THRPL|nr:uncharacterized protein LOC117643005 [Thrips palmi]
MLPEFGFAGSMQTTQELSPRSAEPAVLGDADSLEVGDGLPLGDRDLDGDSLGAPGGVGRDSVLHTLKGLTMAVKQESEDGDDAPHASEHATTLVQATPSPLAERLAESPLSSRMSASSRSSPSAVMDRLSPAVTHSQTQLQASFHHQQQLQLRQIHQRIKEQQQQQQQQQPRMESSRGSDTGRGRGRRRSRWKLKFHHQALPPEYLDHYEASLASQQGGRPRGKDDGDDKARVIGSRAPRNHKRPAPPAAATPANGSDGEALAAPLPIPVPMPFGLEVLTRYQALLGQGKTDLDPAAFVAMSLMAQAEQAEQAPAKEERPANGQRALLSSLLRRDPVVESAPRTAPSKVMTYQDLPYMGEMTLDNMKPRRGRKPKKADICHLIYKNYGTVIPPDVDDVAAVAVAPVAVAPRPTALPLSLAPRLSRSDVQSRIISSLLEKRLTQEEQAEASQRQRDEPLNLCVRDTRGARDSRDARDARDSPLKIKLLRRHGNFYESNNGVPAAAGAGDDDDDVKSEPASPESEVIEVDADPSLVNQDGDDEDEEDADEEAKQAVFARPDMLYWGCNGASGVPGMYVHPLLYGVHGVHAKALTMAPHVMPSLPPLPPLLRLPGVDEDPIATMAAPPPRASRSDAAPKHHVAAQQSRTSRAAKARHSASPASSPSASPAPAPSPPKRKRSAIFIPPVPAESSSNPTTEVSICKFKFTGGAKPSLQEKKMLSVDAGGNFRYYSGTGDKSMRGYEFFPRESMQQQQQQQLQLQQQQQQQLLPKSYPAHAAPPPPPQSESLRSLLFQNVMESLHMPAQGLQQGLQQGLLGFPPPQLAGTPSWDLEAGPYAHQSQQQQNRAAPLAARKRKTRKSLEREKLEKTFKEKGFLIQTQQLESAEGATYCKFRQLRKFTRYLFRSWKDYLPGSVTEGQGPASDPGVRSGMDPGGDPEGEPGGDPGGDPGGGPVSLHPELDEADDDLL